MQTYKCLIVPMLALPLLTVGWGTLGILIGY